MLLKQIKRLLNRLVKAIKDVFRPKTGMSGWAYREIDIACKRERAGNKTPEGEWDYGCACYESALKAYRSLMKDGHSGWSIGMTKHILNRLIEGKPLTAIEDTPDIWNDISDYRPEEGYTDYQCKRMSSLFKYVYANGNVKYSDIDSYRCINLDNNSIYTSDLVQRVMDEMFPITLPYLPPRKPTKVYCEELLTDPVNGDFDTIGIIYAIKADGERIEINRYFKEAIVNLKLGWDEIDDIEYLQRKEIDRQRRWELRPEFLKKDLNISVETPTT